MAPNRKTTIAFLMLLWSGVCFSQNIIPNPSFEVSTNCPPPFGFGWLSVAVPWKSATLSSPDYFNVCSQPNTVGVPYNYFGFQQPHTGIAYAGFILKDPFPNYREYIEVPLTEPMQAGYTYTVSFWINRANNYCALQRFGVYISVGDPFENTTQLMSVEPQWEAPVTFYNDSLNWVLISGCVVATGGEDWIVFGNFHDDSETPLLTPCTEDRGYYHIDDVSLEIGELAGIIDMDLGDPVEACGSYVISPNIPNVIYTWEDGSHGNTFEVTESGNYAVTITANCMIGMDSIDVIINSFDTIQIVPEEFEMCEGETITISLDPDLGVYEWQDGSNDPNYVISTSGSYEVTLDDGCVITTDGFDVIVYPEANFSLGPDTFLCPGDDLNFFFDPGIGDFEWQDNNSGNQYSITEEGTYSLTISNVCGEFTDEVNIIAIPIPDYTLGPGDAILCNGEIIDIDLDPTLGDFLWQDGSTSPSYSISSAGYYSVTVTNECAAVDHDVNVTEASEPYVYFQDTLHLCSAQLPYILTPDSVYAENYLWQNASTLDSYVVTAAGNYSLTVFNDCGSATDGIVVVVNNNAVIVDLPDDQNLCEGQTLLLDASNTSGNYLWQDGSVNSTFLVSQAGSYHVAVSNVCGVGYDTIHINYIAPLAVPDLGQDISLCPGAQVVLDPAVNGVSFLWQDTSTADTFLVTNPGTYYVQIADACTSASDTILITLDANPPQLSLPDQISLCQGTTIILDALTSGVSYLWNDGSTADTLLVTSPGVYTLAVNNACGADIDSISVLDAGPPPTIDLGIDISLCPGDQLTLTPTSSDVNTWLWSDGSSLDTYNINAGGTISVEVSNDCGTAFDTLISTLLPATPAIDLGNDTSLCSGNSLTLTINAPNVNILWSDGSTNSQFTINNPGTYFATIQNSCGENSDTIIVDQLPAIPPLNLGNDQSLCAGEVITLDPGILGVDYSWQDGSTNTSLDVTQGGEYILIISNACGTNTDTIHIVESNVGPDVDLGPDILACEGEVVDLVSNIGGVDFLWQDGSTDDQLQVTNSGLYYVEVSNNCGVDIDSVNVVIDGVAPDTDLGQDTTLCEGTSLLLSSTADVGTSIVWNDGSTGTSFTIQTPGTYTLSESNHCGENIDSIKIDFLSAPTPFDLGADTVLCPNDSIILQAPATVDGLNWQDGSHSDIFIVKEDGVFSLTISNLCGAEADQVIVTYNSQVPLVQLEAMQSLCPGDEILLDATQVIPVTYLWNTGSTESSILVDAPGDYDVKVKSYCAETVGAAVIIWSDTCDAHNAFYIPNVFSPNDDGSNDFFTIYFEDEIQVKSVSASIFDRWGNLVYESTGDHVEWKGDFHGEMLNPDVFAYRLLLTYDDGVRERSVIVHGDVTLLR